MSKNNVVDDECSLDDVEVKAGKMEKFMVEKDKKYRVGFCLLNDKGRILIVKVDHYSFTTGTGEDEQFNSWRKSADQKVNDAAEAAGAVLKSHFVTLVVRYACDKDGKPLLPLQWEVMPVKLDPTKVASLKEINAEWDLANVDVSITSQNPTYQYHTYTPLKKAIWRLPKGDELLAKLKLEEPITELVLEKAKLAKETMKDAIAQEWKDATIMKKIGASKDEESIDPEALDKEFESLGEDDLG